MARDRTPALMAASTHTGRCGPCCSTAPTGSIAMQLAASIASKSAVVMSAHSRFGRRSSLGAVSRVASGADERVTIGARRDARNRFVRLDGAAKVNRGGVHARACAMVVGARRSRTRDGDSARYHIVCYHDLRHAFCVRPKQILERSLDSAPKSYRPRQKYPVSALPTRATLGVSREDVARARGAHLRGSRPSRTCRFDAPRRPSPPARRSGPRALVPRISSLRRRGRGVRSDILLVDRQGRAQPRPELRRGLLHPRQGM